MKTASHTIFLILALTMRASEGIPRFSTEWAGKKIVYYHHAMHFTGGPTQHFIFAHEDIPAFKEVRPELSPVPPGLPRITVGETRFPMGGPGVYFLSKEKDLFDVSVAIWGDPDREDPKSIELFVRTSLDGFQARKKAADQRKGSLK